jgi:PRTRC genetic system protein D
MNTPIKKSRDTSSSRVALAIDAGFGLVKFTRRSSDGGAECDFFPSIALDAEAGEDNGADSGLRRDALNVEYDGRRYVVGKHVRDEMVANDFGRDMTDAYYDSRVYHALMRGALGYMGEERINTLVLGLPMHQYENKDRVNTLQDSYTGEIEISPGRSVQIDRAVVHPQPFGGYINLGSRLNEINAVLAQYPDSGIAALKSQKDLASLNVLIVDPGAYTLDWLLMTPTGANRKVSSAASDAGRHRVIRAVHEIIQAELGRPVGSAHFPRIDDAIRGGRSIRIGGRLIDLGTPVYKNAIEKAVEDPVRQLLEGLRGMDDLIDLIAVMGGEPRDVANAIKRERPYLPVFCAAESDGQNSSMYSNLMGFQSYAKAIDARFAKEELVS